MRNDGKAYAVRDWERHFENSESRKVKDASFVLIPNKHDGKGYARLTRNKKSCRALAGWLLILQVASKMPQRGILVDEDGALDAEDFADMTRFPADVFDDAIEVLTDPAIGWIEEIDLPDSLRTYGRNPEVIPIKSGSVRMASGRVPTCRVEQNRTEQKEQNRRRRRSRIEKLSMSNGGNEPSSPPASSPSSAPSAPQTEEESKHPPRARGQHPRDLKQAIEAGKLHGIHPQLVEIWFDRRKAANWQNENAKTGTSRAITNWQGDLVRFAQRWREAKPDWKPEVPAGTKPPRPWTEERKSAMRKLFPAWAREDGAPKRPWANMPEEIREAIDGAVGRNGSKNALGAAIPPEQIEDSGRPIQTRQRAAGERETASQQSIKS